MNETAATSRPNLSFSFAKRHGVIITEVKNDRAHLLCRQDVTPTSIAEVRRLVSLPLAVQRVDSEAFDQLLRTQYEAGQNAAQDAVEGLEDDIDLEHLAQDLPEPSDLLESDDHAPIIKLINALFTQAVKENASDIHIEPQEKKLVIRFRIDGILHLQTEAVQNHAAPI